MVRSREDVEGFDAAILMHPKVWEASSHVSGFNDPLVDCKVCKARVRADQLDGSSCPHKPSKKPGEHTGCQLTEPRQFNLMFKTFIGPVEDTAAVVYCLDRWCLCLETGNRDQYCTCEASSRVHHAPIMQVLPLQGAVAASPGRDQIDGPSHRLVALGLRGTRGRCTAGASRNNA
ncbi:MAG: hypothetical protein C0497_11350 [Gemmatimonas sp.]|nr:hypothetical protein [Gemmatimonas sp.]